MKDNRDHSILNQDPSPEHPSGQSTTLAEGVSVTGTMMNFWGESDM